MTSTIILRGILPGDSEYSHTSNCWCCLLTYCRSYRVIGIKLRLFHDLLTDPRNKFGLITRGTLSHL